MHKELLAKNFLEFQEYIGLPEHPATLKPCPMTPAQMDFYQNCVSPTEMNWVHLNKARQCGWTEMILRIFAYHGFHKYQGKKIGIVAGTNINTTKQIFKRLKDLFTVIPETIQDKGSMEMHLVNGTSFYAGAANPETFTGWTKFAAFLLDESAKWNLLEDRPVLDATLPIARASQADIYMISTPKGPRGFFYHIGTAKEGETDFTRVEYDIWKGGKGLYTQAQMQKMIETSEADPAQEYLCQYTIGRGSIWGFNTDNDYTTEYPEQRFDKAIAGVF